MKYEIVKKYGKEQFRRITGVKKETLNKMMEILLNAYILKHSKGGRKPKLTIKEMFLAALEYLREYRTYAHIAASYGVAECNIFQTIRWVEDVLIKDGTFSLPGRKELLKSEVEYEVVLIVATETPIERPKKTKVLLFRKKKRHTLKTQVVVNKNTGQVICTSFSNEKTHDFKLYKQSRVHFKDRTKALVGTGI